RARRRGWRAMAAVRARRRRWEVPASHRRRDRRRRGAAGAGKCADTATTRRRVPDRASVRRAGSGGPRADRDRRTTRVAPRVAPPPASAIVELVLDVGAIAELTHEFLPLLVALA